MEHHFEAEKETVKTIKSHKTTFDYFTYNTYAYLLHNKARPEHLIDTHMCYFSLVFKVKCSINEH